MRPTRQAPPQRLGRPHSTSFCEPLIHNGRTFLTNTGKAYAFVQQYAAVNRLSFEKKSVLKLFQPASFQRNWPTALPLTPLLLSLGIFKQLDCTHRQPGTFGSQDDTTPYMSFIRHPNARFIIYTDGSATAGTLYGGAEMVVTEGDPANPTTLLTKQQRRAAITT